MLHPAVPPDAASGSWQDGRVRVGAPPPHHLEQHVLVHLRVTSPPERTAAVRELFEYSPGTANLAVLEGSSVRPPGDLLLADVARESADDLITGLRGLGIDEVGTISMEAVDTAVSEAARRAEEDAPGEGSDAVIWEAVVRSTADDAALSWTFVVFLTLATVLAAIAVVTDSAILVIGAMVVGPEFGPLAAVAVGLVHGRFRLIGRAFGTLLTGFAVSIAVVTLLTLLARATGTVDVEMLVRERPQTGFIWTPDRWSFIVAFVAGIAGVLSLTSAKSSALVGVFISVTTVPAAGNLAMAVAFWNGPELKGSAAQLGLNVGALLLAGVLTLLAQRLIWRQVTRRSRPKESLLLPPLH
jgi:uncharacterized hydrophobic protein (TIGR00271 family)